MPSLSLPARIFSSSNHHGGAAAVRLTSRLRRRMHTPTTPHGPKCDGTEEGEEKLRERVNSRDARTGLEAASETRSSGAPLSYVEEPQTVPLSAFFLSLTLP